MAKSRNLAGMTELRAEWAERVEAMAGELVERATEPTDEAQTRYSAYFVEVFKQVGSLQVVARLYQLVESYDGSVVEEPDQAVTVGWERMEGPAEKLVTFQAWPTVDMVWAVFKGLVEQAQAEEPDNER